MYAQEVLFVPFSRSDKRIDNVQWTIDNYGVCFADYLNNFRRKYLHCQLSIINCQFGRQSDKGQIE